MPIEPVDVVVSVQPERCRRGQQLLPGDDPPPQRPQVTEIPPVMPVVTAYQWHQLVCSACGAVTRAELPPGVPMGGFGPRVQALTARCTGASHRSQRTAHAVLADLGDVSLGRGTMANLEHATTQAVAEPVAEARADVPAQPTAYADETGWREGPHRAWLWTVVTAWVTVFAVRRARRGQVAQALRGERFWGWRVTDRWSAYTWSPSWRRQLCWAHRRRNIDALIARGGRAAQSGEAWRGHARRMFHDWPRVRDGTLSHTSGGSGVTCGPPPQGVSCRP
jgi:transposase